MPYKNLDQTIYLIIQISNLYMRKHGITPREFIELDDKCDIIGYLFDGYEPFHLTGEQGALQELEDYIALERVK